MIESLIKFGEAFLWFALVLAVVAVLGLLAFAAVVGLRRIAVLARPVPAPGAPPVAAIPVLRVPRWLISVVIVVLTLAILVLLVEYLTGGVLRELLSGSNWSTRKSAWLSFYLIVGALIWVFVGARQGASGHRGWGPAVGGLLLVVPALGLVYLILHNDFDVDKMWKSAGGIESDASVTSTGSPGVISLKSLKGREQVIVPDCSEGTETWTLSPGQVLKNKKGCGLTFKPTPNPDGTKSVGSVKFWGAPTYTQWEVSTPSCTNNSCGKGIEEIRADQGTPFTVILGLCPPGKADPNGKSFACRS